MQVDQSHGQVNSSSTPSKSSFCFLWVGQPGQSKGRLEPYAKSKIYAKIDSLSTRVILTLLIKSYKGIYLLNKLYLTLFSRSKLIKHFWHEINDVKDYLTL